MTWRVCSDVDCGKLTEARLCSQHEAERRQKEDAGRPTPAARGYGIAHQRLRARWARKVATGTVACARCGRLITPGAPWDLGHDDNDRSLPQQPEHAACNRATKTIAKVARQ